MKTFTEFLNEEKCLVPYTFEVIKSLPEYQEALDAGLVDVSAPGSQRNVTLVLASEDGEHRYWVHANGYVRRGNKNYGMSSAAFNLTPIRFPHDCESYRDRSVAISLKDYAAGIRKATEAWNRVKNRPARTDFTRSRGPQPRIDRPYSY